jgi:hypothetical protein
MNQDELEWVREAFASGSAAKLRLVTDHTIYECGEAAGIKGAAWWKFENGNPITSHRAETLAPVLRRLRTGERLGAGDSAEAVSAPPAAEDAVARRARHEIALLVAAENFMSLSPAELVKAAPQWDSSLVRETRTAARRVLRKRIFELGGEPASEESP